MGMGQQARIRAAGVCTNLVKWRYTRNTQVKGFNPHCGINITRRTMTVIIQTTKAQLNPWRITLGP